VLQSATPEDLKAYHAEHLTKDRALLVVVGDVTPDMIRNRASELAAALPAGSVDSPPDFGSFTPGGPDIEIAERELPTNYIRGQFKAPSLADPDYPAFSAAMRILRNKLFEEVRTKRNLSYAPAAGLSQRVQNYGLIYVSTAFPDTTIKVMFATIDEMIDSPLPAQTVKNEISQSITRNLMQQETAEAQMGQLAAYELVAGDYRLADDYLTKLEQLKPEDIQAVMKKYVKDIHFGIVGDPSKIDTELFTQK
jgi:predicted Zn-dependent peptidase